MFVCLTVCNGVWMYLFFIEIIWTNHMNKNIMTRKNILFYFSLYEMFK